MCSTLSCPHCHIPLESEHAGGIVAQVCSSCGGMWVDNAGARRIVATFEAAISALSRHMAVRAIRPRQPLAGPIACPVCGLQLHARHMGVAGVDVDLCHEHGTWFDAGELDRVVEAMHPEARDPAPANQHPPCVLDRSVQKGLAEVDEELLRMEVERWSHADTSIIDSLLPRLRTRGRGRWLVPFF